MDEELRIALSKKEKIELFLANLDMLKAEGAIEETLYQDLKAEYVAMLEKVNVDIKSIKTKLRSEFERKANELENLQKEHDLLEARFSVGEMRSESYRRQIKPVRDKVGQLKKEVPKLRILVGATSSSELGGPAKVDIPELKVKKIPKKMLDRIGRVRKAGAGAAAGERRKISGTEEAYVGGKGEEAYPVDRKNIISGIRAAAIVGASLLLVVIIFVAGWMLSTLEDHTAPVISGVNTSAIGSSVIIEWLTNERTTSEVIVREHEGDYTLTETDRTMVTEHSVKINDVNTGVKYQVTITSVDDRGNEAVYEMEKTLIAGAQVDLAPPVLSDVAVSDITDIGAAITWKTDEPATSQVMVIKAETTESYLTEPTGSLDTRHSVILFDLKPDVTYTFTLVSEDANGNQAMYELGAMFTTLSSFPVGPEIGKRAPDFTLKTVDGSNLTLSSFRGKTVIIKFWQRSCPACVREMPVMQSFWDKAPEDNIVILAVNAGDNAPDIEDFVDRWKLSFPVLLDFNRKVVADYGISSTPVAFLLDSQGIIRMIRNEAFSNSADIESTINYISNTGMNR